MKKIFSKLLGGALLFSLTMSLTSCEDVLGHWEKPSPTPTVEEVIKYGFQVTDLAGADRTEAVTSLKMSNEDGTLVAEAEVSGGKITIKNTDLTAAAITAAADFWFEATIGTRKYVAKANIDPATLSPESDKTLTMATLGDLAGQDGKFYATKEDIATAGTTAVGVIAYIGSDAYSESIMDGGGHGLVLCLKNAASNVIWSTNKTSQAYTGNAFVTDVAGLKRTTGVSGYLATVALATDATTYPAASAAKNYTGLTAPAGTTGWFLPSVQQIVKMISALGEVELPDSYGSLWLDTSRAGATKWENAMAKAGTQGIDYDTMTKGGGNCYWYWTSSENNVGTSYQLGFNHETYGSFRLCADAKDDSTNCMVRPVLAF